MRLALRPFATADLPAAGRLLAAHHRTRRVAHPALPERFTRDDDARELLAAIWHTAGAAGVIATTAGEPVAYLLGLPARSIARAAFVPAGGFAASPAAPPEAAACLYDELAHRWRAQEVHQHHLVIDDDDPGASDWRRRGFREYLTLALGPTPPPTSGCRPDVRLAGHADLDTVIDLIAGLRAQRRADAMPGVPPPDASAERAAQLETLGDPRSGCWLATDAGRAIGLVTIRPPGVAIAPLHRPDDAVHLTDAVVHATARGRGIGAALVHEALGWTHLIGYRQCLLHWQPENVSGARFWRRLGFRSLAHHLVRTG